MTHILKHTKMEVVKYKLYLMLLLILVCLSSEKPSTCLHITVLMHHIGLPENKAKHLYMNIFAEMQGIRYEI